MEYLYANSPPPPQPAEPFYSPDALKIPARYTRASYHQQFGQQAKPWDNKLQIKRWFQPLAPVRDADEPVFYWTLSSREEGLEKVITTRREAAEVNLPGLYSFPKYVPAPTPAVVIGSFGPIGSYPVGNLIEKEEAEALAEEISSATSEDPRQTAWSIRESDAYKAGPFSVSWNGETRRPWLINVSNREYSAAALAASRHRDGVGAPGFWLADEGQAPRWVSTLDPNDTGEMDPRPEIAFPFRPLADNERIKRTPFTVLVYRTDMPSEFNQPAPGPPADLTELTRMVREIRDGVINLLGRP